MNEPDDSRHYTAEEIAAHAAIPRRTLRYYITLGLVDRPVGETRAAYYTWRHLQQLLEVRKLTEQGLSLERIGEILEARSEPPPAARAPRPGALEIKSHVHLANGVELVLDGGRAGLSAAQIRRLIRATLDAYQQITKESEQ